MKKVSYPCPLGKQRRSSSVERRVHSVLLGLDWRIEVQLARLCVLPLVSPRYVHRVFLYLTFESRHTILNPIKGPLRKSSIVQSSPPSCPIICGVDITHELLPMTLDHSRYCCLPFQDHRISASVDPTTIRAPSPSSQPDQCSFSRPLPFCPSTPAPL
jgi:hypothetical protein